jgi:uncharacterized protein (TIGR02265 family)
MSRRVARASEPRIPHVLEEELLLRLALTVPSDRTRGLFPRSTLEAVRELGEEAVRRCEWASGEERLVEFLTYPIGTYLRMVFVAARLLEARCGGFDAALRELGQRAARCFLASAAGLTLQLVAGGSVKELVGHLPSAYGFSTGFGTRSVVWTGPTSGRLCMRREFMPYPFLEGVLLGVLDKARARGARVSGRQLSTLESDYEVSWEV